MSRATTHQCNVLIQLQPFQSEACPVKSGKMISMNVRREPNRCVFSASRSETSRDRQIRLRTRLISAVWILFLATVLVGARAAPARSDALVFNAAAVAPNIAEVRIAPDGVHVALEIYVGNLRAFADLIPDDWFSDTQNRPDLAQRLTQFAQNGISIQDENGRVLPVALRTIERRFRVDRSSPLAGQEDPLSGQLVPSPPEDQRVVYAELFYDFGDIKPQTLVFSPPSSNGSLPALAIGMLAFDRDVPLADFSFLSQDMRLLLDWEDAWFSKFKNPNMTRRHKSGLTTFLYVEPREVRHESLIRVRDLEAWLDIRFSSGDMLQPEEQAKLVSEVLEFIATRNPVYIDGQPQEIGQQYGRLLTLDETGLQIVEDGQSVGADASFVGVVLSFPQQRLPDEVWVDWDMFSDRYTRVPATLYDPAGPFISGATPDDPRILWTNHLLTYEDPVVIPVDVGTAGQVRVPVLLLLGVCVALAAGITSLRSEGLTRIAGASVVVTVLAGLYFVRDAAVIYVQNPLDRSPDKESAASAFGALLENVNTANLEVTREARERELEPLVNSASLADVAAELDRALAVRVPTGALARVTQIRDLTLEDIGPLEGGFGFRALANWSAEATASHWGHNHLRLLEYRALIEVIEESGFWTLDGITILEVASPDLS